VGLSRKKFKIQINNNRVGEKDRLVFEKDRLVFEKEHLAVGRWGKMVGPRKK